MTTVPAGDADLIKALRDAADEEDNCAIAQDFWHADLLRQAADRLAAANERAEEFRSHLATRCGKTMAAESRLAEANFELKAKTEEIAIADGEIERLKARLAEAEREATEDRRLIGDLRTRIAALTDLLRRAWRDDPGWLTDTDAALNPEEATNAE